jgi:hypothetical protein
MRLHSIGAHQGSLTEGEGLSTVDLLVLTRLDQLLFTLNILLTSFTKQATLMRKSTVLSLPPYLVFLGAHLTFAANIKLE